MGQSVEEKEGGWAERLGDDESAARNRGFVGPRKGMCLGKSRGWKDFRGI